MDITCLYREDFPKGKDFPLSEAKRLIEEEGWLDTPAKIGIKIKTKKKKNAKSKT